MADKFRQTFPIAVSFSEGELPTASKLTGLATQARSGQSVMQYAIGDVWNQGGDSLLTDGDGLSDNALMIPNLARYLGAAKHSNPFIPALPDTEAFYFKFTGYSGEYEAVMPFPLASGAATPTWTSSVGTEPSTLVASRGGLNSNDDYYIDDAGRIFTYLAMNANWVIKYEPDVTGSIGADATYNVIPDPFTDTAWGFLGLKIEYKNGSDNLDGYYIYLPPRMPRYDFTDSERPGWYPEPTNNMSTTPTTEKLLWQDTSTSAPTGSNAEHYRYKLPVAITGSSAWAAGVTLPAGMLYLWDENNTGTILEGVTFQALPSSPTKWGLFVPNGTQLDAWLADPYGATHYPEINLQSSSHAPAQYPAAGLKLITVGSDVSQLISSLMTQFLNHDHSDVYSMPTKPVDHGQLKGGFYNGGTPVLHVSGFYNSGDHHPQYLERHGYSTSRDKYGNSMLGDIMMSSTDPGSNYLNTTLPSNKLLFSKNSESDGAAIWNSTGSFNGLVLRSRRSAADGYIYFGDPNTYNEWLRVRNDVSAGAVYLQNTLNNQTLYVAMTGGTSANIDLNAGGWTRLRAGSEPSMSLSSGDIGFSAGDDMFLWAKDIVDIVAGYDNSPHSRPGSSNDLTLRSGSDVFLRAKGVVDIYSSGETRLDGAGHLDLIPGGTMYLYPGGNLYMNKLPILNYSRTFYIGQPVMRWHQDRDLNERFLIFYDDSRFWISRGGATIPKMWTLLRDFPTSGTTTCKGVRVFIQCDDRDEVFFYLYRGTYWNSNNYMGAKYHYYPSGGGELLKISANENVNNNECILLGVKHQDDNSTAGGPDGWLYFYGMAEVEMNTNVIAAW